MAWQAAVKIVSTPFALAMGARFNVFWESRPCVHAGWLALLLIKAGVVGTDPCRTTTHKQVWICDICHIQIHRRKKISIRCKRIEHWVHLRCAGMRLAQYTDTWTYHLHNESGLTTHHNQNTDTHPTHTLFPQDWYSPYPILLSTHPLLLLSAPTTVSTHTGRWYPPHLTGIRTR